MIKVRSIVVLAATVLLGQQLVACSAQVSANESERLASLWNGFHAGSEASTRVAQKPAPAALLALLIVFTVVPVVGLVWMSFHEREWQSGIGVWRFVGLDQWREFAGNLTRLNTVYGNMLNAMTVR